MGDIKRKSTHSMPQHEQTRKLCNSARNKLCSGINFLVSAVRSADQSCIALDVQLCSTVWYWNISDEYFQRMNCVFWRRA